MLQSCGGPRSNKNGASPFPHGGHRRGLGLALVLYCLFCVLCVTDGWFLFVALRLVFTMRRYAKRGICRRRVSVCMCVCPVCRTPVLYQNGLT